MRKSGKTGDKLGGVTIYNHSTRLSDVYFSPANLRSHDLLFLTMQHEYVHVQLNYNGYYASTNKQEVAAYKIQIAQMRQWGYDVDDMGQVLKFYQSKIDYNTQFLINFKPTIRQVRPW